MVVPTTTIGPRSFDLASYARRGWCRLEQWARLAQHSTEHMYVCDGGRPHDISKDVSFLTQVRGNNDLGRGGSKEAKGGVMCAYEIRRSRVTSLRTFSS
jgi:hypothetical protein